jgi:hypothetical protein
VEANATERAIRGSTAVRKLDSIYRTAHERMGGHHPTHIRQRLELSPERGPYHAGRLADRTVDCDHKERLAVSARSQC